MPFGFLVHVGKNCPPMLSGHDKEHQSVDVVLLPELREYWQQRIEKIRTIVEKSRIYIQRNWQHIFKKVQQ